MSPSNSQIIDSLYSENGREPIATDSLLRPGFLQVDSGLETDIGRPSRRVELDLPALLSTLPGMMAYSFGTPGWPSSISPFGLDPNQVDLQLDGIRLNDLISGRPRFDLLPYVLLESVRTRSDPSTRPFGVLTQSGAFSSASPKTDIRYRSTNTGLQSIGVVHAQSRRVSIFRPEDRLNIVIGYAGAAADGEYPGSRLERARQLMSRIRLESGSWTIEIFELYNRRKVGAHGGVIPLTGRPYSSIYQRLGATVTHSEAKRTTIRNDLSIRFRTLIRESPFTFSGFWSTQTLQYKADSDTVLASVGRLGVSAVHKISGNQNSLRFSATAWQDHFRHGNAFIDGFDKGRSFVEFVVGGSSAFGSVLASGSVGIHADDGYTFASASIGFTHRYISLSVSTSGTRSTWMEDWGFGTRTTPLEKRPGSRVDRLRLDLHHKIGDLRLGASLFYLSETGKFTWMRDGLNGQILGQTNPDALTHTGAALEISYRNDEERGVYTLLRPAFIRASSSRDSELGRLQSSAVPEFWINGRLGMRALLFRGDLDVDLSVRAYFWESMVGRRLDTRSGLLVLPSDDSQVVPSSTMVDVVAEAGVRTATIFLAYENIFSGTNALVGNLLVPDYPLPAKRFRFGVFWPITD